MPSRDTGRSGSAVSMPVGGRRPFDLGVRIARATSGLALSVHR